MEVSELVALFPAVDVEMLAFGLVCFQAGAAVPVYYFEERLRGFGRAVADRFMPYKPPVGMSKQEALRTARPETPDDSDPSDSQ
jgi:hypothetical protein